jgi:threonylcarbamoyladenosine tRNA methylthiotransferase MtaB
VTTDLIVGFPGETDDDFAAGLAYVAAQRFLHAHIFPYSARAGTAAASFADATPAATKRARQQQIAAVVAATGAEERARFLGALRPVLWEGAGQPLADQPGRTCGAASPTTTCASTPLRRQRPICTTLSCPRG